MQRSRGHAFDTRINTLMTWCEIASLFVGASLLQVGLYARPLWGGHPFWGLLPEYLEFLYIPSVLLFAFAPAIAATVAAVFVLGEAAAATGTRLRLASVFAILLLAALSSYAGVLVAVNLWGT